MEQGFYVDPVLYEGRPQNPTGREARELAVYDLLDRLGVAYARADHDPAMTIADCGAVDRLLGVAMCKNLFLCNAQHTAFYLLLLPGNKPFRTKDLSRQIGSARLSFADAAHMEEYLDILPGAVSVMGLMNDTGGHVRLLIDRDVTEAPYIGCHPCVNTSSLRIRTPDLLGRFLPHVGHAPTFVTL